MSHIDCRFAKVLYGPIKRACALLPGRGVPPEDEEHALNILNLLDHAIFKLLDSLLQRTSVFVPQSPAHCVSAQSVQTRDEFVKCSSVSYSRQECSGRLMRHVPVVFFRGLQTWLWHSIVFGGL
jgi:hypothetical protein